MYKIFPVLHSIRPNFKVLWLAHVTFYIFKCTQNMFLSVVSALRCIHIERKRKRLWLENRFCTHFETNSVSFIARWHCAERGPGIRDNWSSPLPCVSVVWTVQYNLVIHCFHSHCQESTWKSTGAPMSCSYTGRPKSFLIFWSFLSILDWMPSYKWVRPIVDAPLNNMFAYIFGVISLSLLFRVSKP